MRSKAPKTALALLLCAASCSSAGSGSTSGTGGAGGTSATAGTGGGASGVPGTGGTVGGANGGAAGTGPAGTGGGAAGTGGAAGGASGRGGATGAGGATWRCPAGPFTAPSPSTITLTKVAGVPPLDTFNNNGNNSGNIEGDCWFGDALYVSEIAGSANPPPSRILRVTAAGVVSVAYPSAGATPGTNGLAIDLTGRLIGASHGAGAILALDLAAMTSSPIVSTYMGNRFDSPNDLTVRSDGTLYFTDPDFQAPATRPQTATRVYRLPPGATTPIVVDAGRSNPNGITLSLDEAFLFLTDGQGLWRYPVNADGSTGAATRIAQSAVTSGDGMGIDCMGNLYVASRQSVVVVDPTGTGTSLGTIRLTSVQSVTNIAFGGANHQTLYVSGLGNGMGATAMGLYRADMPLPGMPY